MLHELPDFRSPEPTPGQERDQPPFPHRGGKSGKLASPLFGERPDGVREVNALGRERRVHCLLGDATVYALLLQIAHQPSRTAATGRLREGVILGEPHVVEQSDGAQPFERGIDGARRMLSLEQPAPQIKPRVRPTRQRAKRGAMRRLEIGQFLQPLQD
jgi:hypothetical protein